MSYQFRFEIKEEEFSKIFMDSEISEKLNRVICENEEKVNKFIHEVKEEVILLIEKQKKQNVDFKNSVADENKVKEECVELLKSKILWLAVMSVFYSQNFNVKENILQILDTTDFFEKILKERVVVTFSSLTDYEFDDELEKKFL